MRLLIILLLMLSPCWVVYAEYVLPYPSYMPGHKLYKFSRITDELKIYWYWGNIAKIKYHQGLSDKYLVEAKTLFEYKQYPLALDALRRSDKHFQKGLIEIAQTHTATLTGLKDKLPMVFVWQDEKKEAITLMLHDELNHSLGVRNE